MGFGLVVAAADAAPLAGDRDDVESAGKELGDDEPADVACGAHHHDGDVSWGFRFEGWGRGRQCVRIWCLILGCGAGEFEGLSGYFSGVALAELVNERLRYELVV